MYLAFNITFVHIISIILPCVVVGQSIHFSRADEMSTCYMAMISIVMNNMSPCAHQPEQQQKNQHTKKKQWSKIEMKSLVIFWYDVMEESGVTVV